MKANQTNITFLNVAVNWETNPRIPVLSVEQLRALLAELSDKEPGIVNLESTTSGLLQLGIGGPFACAQFTTLNNRYLCARAQTVRAKEDVEFLLGGTPTPVDPKHCLSFGEAVRIAEHFFTTGDRDPTFEWVEI